MINIHISSQTLELIIDKSLYKIYQISSAKNGLGEKKIPIALPEAGIKSVKKLETDLRKIQF